MRLNQALTLYLLLTLSAVCRAEADAAAIEHFEKKVRPVLVEHCYSCHSKESKKLKAKLRVDALDALLSGGESGPAVVPGKPEKSLLIEAVSYKNTEMQMPPKSKLSDQQIADMTEWVRQGAPWPGGSGTASVKHDDGFNIETRKAEHWSWAPVKKQTPPAVKNTAWPKSPIDNFVLAKLEEKNLPPAPPADKRTLLRRAHYTITGLPPVPEQIEAFLKDNSPNAFEKVIDQLLSAPQFGERWGRHWLDLMRYADSRGHEFDFAIPNAFQYRDYVIRALNADLPYDQFVREHLAGDLLPEPRMNPAEGFNESIIGTAFWFLGEGVHSPVDIRLDEAERFDNMVDVMCKSFLGLTVACARCHDHKFDAISTKDYYRLFGFLQSSNYRLARFDTLDHNKKVAAELWKFRAEQQPAVAKALAASLRPAVEKIPDYLLASREAVLAAPEAFAPAKNAKPKETPTLSAEAKKQIEAVAKSRNLDAATLEKWLLHLRGDAKQPGDVLHAWSKFALDQKATDLTRVSEFFKQAEAAKQQTADALKNLEIIQDYASADDWLPDDVSFAGAPRKRGELIFGGNAANPVERIAEIAAAEFDPTFDGYKLAANASNDPVGLAYMRAGKTLRTRTFTIKGERVFFLVRGNGRAYAAVDSHALINGPLHGKVLHNIEPRGSAWNWQSVELRDYKDHRAHLEFTAESPDFAVALVAQGASAPPVTPFISPVFNAPGSFESLAKAYGSLFAGVLPKLESGQLSGDDAVLANWLVSHRVLVPQETNEGLKSFGEAQAKITSRIKLESRLTMAMMDGTPEDEYVMIRGSWKKPGEIAPRGLLEGLAGKEPLKIARGSGRLELAQQLTSASNPFFTRVMANRVWHLVIGRGIVPSVDNFGVLGDKPTHPELLDYLADQFVANGMSIKKLIRSIMLSSTYQMSSALSAAAAPVDPDNVLLHRMHVKRLEGEAIRDSILQISGKLSPQMYGPSVPIFLTDFMQGRGRPQSGPLDGNGRRSIYLGIQRNFLSPMMLAFDTPIPFNTMGKRAQSNVPAQALILMNDPFVIQQAELWAKRVIAESASPEHRITRMYVAAFARPPTDKEMIAARAFLEQQAKELAAKDGMNDARVWADLAHVLINTKEFIFVN